MQIFPQDEHERLLIERLEALGVSVERRTELVGFTDEGERVIARFAGPRARKKPARRATSPAATAPARSCARRSARAFPAAPIGRSSMSPMSKPPARRSTANCMSISTRPISWRSSRWPEKGRARLIGTVRDERADHADTLKFEDVSDRAINHLKVEVRKVNWFSTYHVHHRVTAHFRKGRAFLLGDAAHIHSPAGGQGMNTGIGDAINLAWKLAAVLAGRAPDKLLDSYEAERIGFARRLVATTDRVFSFVTAEGRIADILRTRVAPILYPKAIAVRDGARIPFPHRLADHPELSRRSAEPWRGRSCPRRRPAAVGADRRKGQFRTPRGDDLAGPCLWDGERRARGLVRRSRCAAARLRLATGA